MLTNKISKESLKPGDHIYSWRQGYVYAHHGIYSGENQVIHFTVRGGQEVGTSMASSDRFIFRSPVTNKPTQPCLECGNHSNTQGVIKSCLECFLSRGDLYLFSYSVSRALFLATRGGTCTLAKSDPSEEVLHRATYLLQNGFQGYNLLENNCEDFAIYCKTGLVIVNGGEGKSGQISAVLSGIRAAVTSAFAIPAYGFGGMAAVACGVYCSSRLAANIGIRRDIVKLPVEKIVISGFELGT